MSCTLWIMIMTLIKSTFQFIGMKYDMRIYAVIIAGLYVFLYLAGRYKLLWLSLLTIFLLYTPSKIIASIISFKSNIVYFINSVIVNQNIVPKYKGFFVILFMVAVIILGIIFYYITINISPLPFIIFGIGVLASFYYYDYNAVAYNNCFFYLMECVFLLGYSNISRRNRKNEIIGRRQEKKYAAKWIPSLVLFIAVLSCISLVLPNNFKSGGINNFLNRFNELNSSRKSYTNHEKNFEIHSTGYQPDSKVLGGPVSISHKVALKIKTKDDILGAHLRGSVKDEYDGNVWKASNKTLRRIEKDNNIEQYFNIVKSSSEKKKTMKIISYENTTTLFNSLYPTKIYNIKSAMNIDSNDEISSKRAVNEYTIDYKDIKIENNDLINIVKPSTDQNENDKYLDLVSEIPYRVYALTYSITKNYDNPVLKAMAIEDYLKSKYPYSLDTSSLPAERDFVDYFLFDEKKGSCTYYASAMAVMCRIAGIPSRYVEGFIVKDTRADKNGFINVDNSSAHAWVELYFDNVGWITFDPTPGYSFQVHENKSGTDTSKPVVPGTDVTQNKPAQSNKNVNEGNINRTPKAQKIEKQKSGNVQYEIALVLIILIAFIIIARVIIRSNDKIKKYEMKIIAYGKYCGSEYSRGQTFREYCDALEDATKISMIGIVNIYEKYLYGDSKITEQEVEEIKAKVKELKKYALRGSRKFYIPLEYIFDIVCAKFRI